MFIYKTQGVCSTEIHLNVEDNKIKCVDFVRGCQGNLLGISSLVQGMNVDEAISKLKSIKCMKKDTSCPDQLSIALEEFKKTI